MMASVGKRRTGRVFVGACLCVAACCGVLQCSLGSASQLAQAGRGPTPEQVQETFERARQIFAIVNQQHRNTVAKVVALLAIKIVLMHLLTVRARLMLGNMKRRANDDSPWEEDERMPGWFASVMKAVLCCRGPAPSEAFLKRLLGVVANSMETEPWFVGLAVAYGLRGVSSVSAVRYAQPLMWAFLAGRMCHAVAFLLALPQPSRALSYIVALSSLLGLAVVALI